MTISIIIIIIIIIIIKYIALPARRLLIGNGLYVCESAWLWTRQMTHEIDTTLVTL